MCSLYHPAHPVKSSSRRLRLFLFPLPSPPTPLLIHNEPVDPQRMRRLGAIHSTPTIQHPCSAFFNVLYAPNSSVVPAVLCAFRHPCRCSLLLFRYRLLLSFTALFYRTSRAFCTRSRLASPAWRVSRRSSSSTCLPTGTKEKSTQPGLICQIRRSTIAFTFYAPCSAVTHTDIHS